FYVNFQFTKKRSAKARSNRMQLKQVLGKIKDISFGVIAAPLLIIIMMWASILDQRAFKKKRNRKKEQDKT
ncbi:hypothetical protein, partial [Acinetobacter gerneri]